MSEPLAGEVVLLDDETKGVLDQLDTPDNEIAISQMLDKARTWLEVATRQADAPRAVADFKAEIIVVAQYAKQKRVSEEIQIDATVMVRRAERSLGVAIREGQERGEVETASSAATRREAAKAENVNDIKWLPLPSSFASPNELVHRDGGIYALTDTVTEEDFNAALHSAKEESNPSRANVVRKLREAKGEQPKQSRQPKQAKQHTAKTMERLTDTLWGIRQSLQTITAIDAELNQDQVTAWIKELGQTSAELNRIKNLLKESK